MIFLSRVISFIVFFIVPICFFLYYPANLYSATNPPILIVEVQISGEKSSDDYIKLYNNTNYDIYLQNYQESYFRLVKRSSASNKDYTIKSWSKEAQAKIPAKGYFIWANKDFSALSNADCLTSQTIAANNGIALRLGPENTGIIIDAVGWGDFNNVLLENKAFPDNPQPNQKLKRKNIGNSYQDTDDNSQDFYLSDSESLFYENEFQIPSKIEEQKSHLQSEPLNYPAGIIISEFLPSPEGKDEDNEWIELYNQNNFEVDLTDWQIEDVSGKTTIFTFPSESKILPLSFLVLSRQKSKITLNNDTDGLKLIQPNGQIVDSVNYEKAPTGKSYNKIGTQWVWSEYLTPGKTNQFFQSKNTNDNNVEKEKIDINSASKEDLQKIAGIGEVLAERIINNRPFYSLDDLNKINGIGEKIIEEIKKQGLAWVDPSLKNKKVIKEQTALASKPLENIKTKQNILTPQKYFVFFIALLIAVFSGIIILIIKNKLKNFKN